jgi:hypothetical protein
MPWLFTLILYLWIMGGLGWAAAYEHGSDRELTALGKALIIFLWPVFALVSAVEETVSAARELRS